MVCYIVGNCILSLIFPVSISCKILTTFTLLVQMNSVLLLTGCFVRLFVKVKHLWLKVCVEAGSLMCY